MRVIRTGAEYFSIELYDSVHFSPDNTKLSQQEDNAESRLRIRQTPLLDLSSGKILGKKYTTLSTDLFFFTIFSDLNLQ